MRHIISGYVFGVAWGLLYGAFRYRWGADLAGWERVLIAILGSAFVSGPIGAGAAFLVVFCQAAYRRLKQGRSEVL